MMPSKVCGLIGVSHTFILNMLRARRIHSANKSKFSSFRQSNATDQAMLMHTACAKMWNSLTQEIILLMMRIT